MEQLKTVRYITQDPLSNLKLRVHLTCLSRASKVRQTASPALLAPRSIHRHFLQSLPVQVVPQQKPVVERNESTTADAGEQPGALISATLTRGASPRERGK
jgi:hypothetical protein